MKRLNIFIVAMVVALVAGCGSNSSSSDRTTSSSHSVNSNMACLGENCASAECIEKQLISSKDGMLDFCQSPAFGTFAIEKDGITWHFGESVSYGQYVTGDYWVLDKGEGVKLTKITPMPDDGHHGSMINPEVGVQAYDDRLYHYDASKGIKLPVVLRAGDSLVSTISVMPEHLNSKGVIYPSWYTYQGGLRNAKVKNASVLTVVSEVPNVGSFRPAYVGTDKKTYNISDINRTLLPKFKAPATLPDVSYLERGVERPWLMHNRHWTASEMHPVENQHRYFREIGEYLSQVTLVLMTDAATPELLYGFLQTGIDHYHTITMGSADNATFEFHAILTGMLLGDEEIARVWVDGRSKTQGRATDKYYFVGEREPTVKSSIVPEGHSWTGWNVMFAKQDTIEHEHLHPSEWHKVGTGGGVKQENYRHCCDSIPHFGMLLVSRAVKADKYWPSNAVDKYMDRWIWESQYGYGLDVIQEHNPSFKSHLVGKGSGSHPYLLGSPFTDDMYYALGYDGNVPGPTFGKNPEPIQPPVEEVVIEEESASESTVVDDRPVDGSSEVGIDDSPQVSETDPAPTESSTGETIDEPSDIPLVEETVVQEPVVEEPAPASTIVDDRPVDGSSEVGIDDSPQVSETDPAPTESSTGGAIDESSDIPPVEETVVQESVVEEPAPASTIVDDRPVDGSSEVGIDDSPQVSETDPVPTESSTGETSDEPSDIPPVEETVVDQPTTGDDSKEEFEARSNALVDRYRAERKALKAKYKANRNSLRSERNSGLDAINSEHKAKIQELRALHNSGEISIKEFRAQRDKLRSVRNAKRAVVNERFKASQATLKNDFEADKLSLKSDLEADKAVLNDEFNSLVEGNIIEDRR